MYPSVNLRCVLCFFAFWKGTWGLGRPCRSKTNPAPQAGKPETSLSIWGKGAGALSFFQVLLFTVVILPRRDCDFYRKSLQTGPRWWEVESHTYIHTHTDTHTHRHTHTHTYTHTHTHTHASTHTGSFLSICTHPFLSPYRTTPKTERVRIVFF